MPTKKYIVRLSAEERDHLSAIVRVGKVAAYRRCHAQILLKADVGPDGPGWSDAEIAEATDVDRCTVGNVRKRLVEQGLDAALGRKTQAHPSRMRKLDGAGEAHLIAMACAKPPKGRARWTLRLLADRLVELEIVDSISYETVRQTLKKTNSVRI